MRLDMLDAAYEGYYAAATIEQRQRFSKLYDMFLIRNQFQVWGPLQTAFQAANPWVKGWNGEWHLTVKKRGQIYFLTKK